MMKNCILITLLLIIISCTEQKTHIPDDNFEQALIDLGYDSGPLDDYVLTANINNIERLVITQKNIHNLAGIEDFTALQELDCRLNQLTSLDVSKNKALEKLVCSDNQLTSLDISKNMDLTRLQCSYNQLTRLDISKNTHLGRLSCSDNQLTNLDVSKNTDLKELWCYRNQLTNLDVSKNAVLKELDCSSNQLTRLDVSKNTDLTRLECSFNRLTRLDISKITDLIILSYKGNTALTELKYTRDQLAFLDILKNTPLTIVEEKPRKIKIEDYRNTGSDKEPKIEYVLYENLPDSFKIMIETVKKFKVWYGNNHEKLDQDKLVKYSDSQGYYIFNKNHGDFYLKTLKETGLVSDSMISQYRKIFLTAQADFEKDKLGLETDGPIGFVYDIITGWQETPPKCKMEDISIEGITIYSKSPTIIRISYIGISLIYENGKWLIVSSW